MVGGYVASQLTRERLIPGIEAGGGIFRRQVCSWNRTVGCTKRIPPKKSFTLVQGDRNDSVTFGTM